MLKTKGFVGLSLALAMTLVVVGQAHAVTVNVPGRTIDVNQSTTNSNVNVNTNGSNVNTNTNGSSATVNTPGRTTQVSPNSVQTTTGAQTIEVNRGGSKVQIKTNDSLNVQVRQGSLDVAARQAIISLDGGTDVLIANDEDLTTYRTLVDDECAGLTINTGENTVQVKYRQPARLFGIFQSNLDADLTVDAQGSVKVKLPWYSFLFKKSSADVKTQVSANLAGQNITASSGEKSVQLRRQAHVINVAASTVSSTVGGCTTAVEVPTPPQNTEPTPTPSPTPTPGPTVTPTPTPNPTSTQTTVTVADFKGDWNGTYSANSVVAKDCPSGATSLSVDAAGKVTGYAVVSGQKFFGTGTVKSTGEFSGVWNYSGGLVTYSGKFNLSAGTGSGTYQDKLGCFGSFSVKK